MRVLVLTHGNLGRELIAAAKTISGELPGIECLCLDWQEGPGVARDRVLATLERLKTEDEEVLVLTDMFGSTPCNLASSLSEEGRVEVLAGVNLPMVLRLACLRDQGLSLHQTAHWLMEKGRSAICEAKIRTAPPKEVADPCLEEAAAPSR
ncbi:MAG: PTS sugar transporter subunit IIA [Acidobacteria bacterium]|nr:PTS sugar transporter subunit IIA [Acidobacteriota bacterium]